jgi:drug/metabolite transporter (DMT)-like permease
VGYAVWYTALPRLKAIAAANLQLTVPLIASVGGIMLFGEPLTTRLVAAAVLLLGGVALATRQAMRPTRNN